MTTDKRTDVWSRDFIIWKINSGLWAVVSAELWNKGFGPIMSNFWGQFFKVFMDKKLCNLKFFWKYFRVRTEKLHRIKVNKSQKIFVLTQDSQSEILWAEKPTKVFGCCGMRSVLTIFRPSHHAKESQLRVAKLGCFRKQMILSNF